MAVLELSAPTVTEVRIASINVVAIPRSIPGEFDPGATVVLAYGQTTDGNFAPRYFETLTFAGAEFGQFVAMLGSLEFQTLEAVQEIKGLAGTVR